MDSTVLSSIFALVGGAMLVAARWQFTRRRAFVQDSAIASGTIVELIEERVRNTTSGSMNDEISYFPKVKFQTPSGREVTFQSETGRGWKAGQIGRTVAVRYRPDQPDVAEIDSFMSLWGVTLVLGVVGGGFLFAGLGMILVGLF